MHRAPTRSSLRFRTIAFAASVVVSAALAVAPAATSETASATTAAVPVTPEKASLVRLYVPDQAVFQRLVSSGTDLAGRVRPRPDGIEVDAVVTPSRLAALGRLGIRDARKVPVTPPAQPKAKPGAAADQITIERAVWFRTRSGYFISVEATSDGGAGAAMTASWTGAGGSSGQLPLMPFVDAGQYLGHQPQVPAPASNRPRQVTVTSSLGGTATAQVSEWPDGQRPARPGPGYRKDFIDHYMPPAEVYGRIVSLNKRFPKLTSLIKLPYKTNGYRRHAQAVIGTPPASAVLLTSRAYGSEGGNDLRVRFVNPGAADRRLSVQVSDNLISVRLGTNGSGELTSTAAQVASAVNVAASRLVTASTFRGDAGAGVAGPAAAVRLTDNLKAPSSVSRKPMQVLALRIGVHRDGSRTGVYAYSQEHAREWVTPLVTIETAERLLRNYNTDRATRRLLERLDIFILPSVNPDGANYSFYDFNLQRKNMRNHCPAAQSDPGLRNSWGVDLNRNYSAGSLFDGYFGASSDCLSGVYSGPAEHSEPEGRNVIWMAQRFRNIKFAMNVHSFGGYFMWPPGAYKFDGRVTLPRPTEQELDYYLDSARTIEEAIKAERGTVTWPQQTGPVTDVLYSAAGNSADEIWYDYGVFGWDFEVGNDLWNSSTQQWEGVGFQPPFGEGHQEAMEYASGLIALLGVAADFRGRP